VENGPLALGLAGQIFRVQAVTNLRIAAQRAGAAAGNVGQGQVEDLIFTESGYVGEAAFDFVCVGG
jgi:hypothetical protein